MKATCPDFCNRIIPKQYTGFGADISPEIIIEGLPEGTASIAVIMDDLDVPFFREFTHWIIWNIPPVSVIPEGIPSGCEIEIPFRAVQGKAWGKHIYRGPKQPPFIRKSHRYRFSVYALDKMLELSANSGKHQLAQAMSDHVLDSAEAVGTYDPSTGENMDKYEYITLRERPELKETAADWFHSKWGVPTEAYLECMTAYLEGETEYGWYLCLDGDRIIGGLGVIENDFHDRKDLAPNVCAVYTEENYRCRGIAGNLLNMVVADMRAKGISPLYLLTDHTGFYERYGWEFLCMVQGDGDTEMSRMYIHR